ncbi:hypothetical protein [Archangium sp.]|uniref:hypothetical protein n=1 Tax=Archangium sp. TaxID=1872627 RepID=UPI002D3E6D02|nr:hypothetical protein [Archangium sp.]HYO56180.1 hypothetical protein [Archangium sp.]
MLISSKSQIDHAGGYVNNWSTKDYMRFVDQMKGRYPKSKVKICRDHCGPGFNGIHDLEDCYSTIRADIECGFDLIHIDFCHYKGPREEMWEQSRKAIELCLALNPDISLEIGTDDNVGASLSREYLSLLKKDLDYYLSFCKPDYYVVQTGSLTKEFMQVGMYNREFVEAAAALLHESGLHLKEHNADYLSAAEIRKRVGHVDAMNLAPQLGVVQTSLVINRCLVYGIDVTPYLDVCYRGGKWKKWLYKHGPEDKLLCALISGHYHFTSDEYKRLLDSLGKVEDIKESIINEVSKVVDNYAIN